MDNIFELKENESKKDYINRIYEMKFRGMIFETWLELTDIFNNLFDVNFSDSKYRKDYYRYCKRECENKGINIDKNFQAKVALMKERVKLQDERSQINSQIRKIARNEVINELAIEATNKLVESGKILDTVKIYKENNEKVGILALSDWHYGLTTSTPFNQYSPMIAVNRIAELRDRVISICDKENITNLIIVNLGDMISGNIHLPLRINNRRDVVSQTIEVAEILAEFIYDIIRTERNVEYHSVVDNHSRVDPNKADSISSESFYRFIDWHLLNRFEKCMNFKMVNNTLGDDIISFDVFNHKVVAVHGDKDPQRGIINNLNSYTRDHCDLILSAHLHHFSADENNNTEFMCSGSLIGTDDYAHKLRLSSMPSQLLLVSTPENITDVIYKIKLYK